MFTSVVWYCQTRLRRKHGKCSLCNDWWHSFMNQRLNHLVLLYKMCNCIIMSLNTYNKNVDIYRLIHGHFHIGLVIIPRPPYWPETQSRANMGRGMITRPIWKCPCIKLFITYFRHLEKRHPYWPETKTPIWASIWKWSCSNPITGYFPGVWKYGQFTSVILVIQKCLYLK